MALVGVSIGSILAFFYLVGAFYLSMRGKVKPIFYGCKYRPWGKKGYAGRLLAVVLPVSAASVVLSVSSVIDLSVIMKGLVHSGCSLELANELYGNYSGSAVPLFNLPSVLVAPVASAVIPYLAKDTKGKKGDALALAGSSIRLAIIISAPCVFGLSLLANPILTLLFGEESASVASPMLVLLAPAVLFVAVQTVSGAILQGGGMRKTPVMSLACGAAVKLLFCIVLVPRIGLAGAPIGTLACYFVSAFINTYFCVHRKMASFNPLSDFGIPILCAALCGFVSMVMVRVLPDGGIFTLCSIGIGAVIYFVALVLCAFATRRSKRSIASDVRLLLVALAFPIAGNLIIILYQS